MSILDRVALFMRVRRWDPVVSITIADQVNIEWALCRCGEELFGREAIHAHLSECDSH